MQWARGKDRTQIMDGTRIEASTWYQHHMWPAAYWRLWSDAVIHRIHTRVLKHVKALAETRTGSM